MGARQSPPKDLGLKLLRTRTLSGRCLQIFCADRIIPSRRVNTSHGRQRTVRGIQFSFGCHGRKPDGTVSQTIIGTKDKLGWSWWKLQRPQCRRSKSFVVKKAGCRACHPIQVPEESTPWKVHESDIPSVTPRRVLFKFYGPPRILPSWASRGSRGKARLSSNPPSAEVIFFSSTKRVQSSVASPRYIVGRGLKSSRNCGVLGSKYP